MAILPPDIALKPLEPRPGGQWTITGQAQDSFSLSYIMEGGTETITYTMHQCTTEEEILTHCGPLLYEFSGIHPNDGFTQQAGQTPIVSQNIQNPQLHLIIRPPNNSKDLGVQPIEAIRTTNSNSFSFSHQAPIITHSTEQGRGDLRFEHTPRLSQNQLFYHPSLPVGDNSQGFPAAFNPGHIGWPFEDIVLPTNPGNSGLSTLSTMLTGPNGDSPQSRRHSQATWPENWTSLNDLSSHESGIGWQSLFPTS